LNEKETVTSNADEGNLNLASNEFVTKTRMVPGVSARADFLVAGLAGEQRQHNQ